MKSDWGYHPRYEPVYEHSIKARRQALQTRKEAVYDTPRLRTTGNMYELFGNMDPRDTRMLVNIAKEHNRRPGSFDYSIPQDFYSTFMNVDSDSYVTVGNWDARRKVRSD